MIKFIDKKQANNGSEWRNYLIKNNVFHKYLEHPSIQNIQIFINCKK